MQPKQRIQMYFKNPSWFLASPQDFNKTKLHLVSERINLIFFFMLLIWHLPAMTEDLRGNENIVTLHECDASSFALFCARINKQESESKCMNSKNHPSVLTHFRDKEEFKPKCLIVFLTKQKTIVLMPHTASAYKVYLTSNCFNIRTQLRGVFIPRKTHPAFLQASAIPSLIVSVTSTSSLPQAK